MSGTQVKSPVDDLTYDLLTALQNKLQALSVYEKFMKDAAGDEACQQIFRQMAQDDRKHAEMLQGELSKHLGGEGSGGTEVPKTELEKHYGGA